ncbi:MAG: RNA polymerase sigma factor [Clostridia bacterium]|nr:RNA polymerase sigma factor [Clostridia bacterium]
MDENELILRCKKGDAESFSQLIMPYEKKIINYAYRMLNDESDAEDAAQEALLKAWNKIDSFSGNSRFSTWLYTILNNVCLDILRKKKRTGEFSRVSINQSNTDDEEYEIQIEDTSDGPFEQYRKKEAGKALEKAISELPQKYKEVILMRDIEGLEYDEIAKVINASLGTVKSRISRGRGALRKILEENRELFM